MDMEQEDMQFLGFFGRTIFSQITLALVLPLSFIFLAQMEDSKALLSSMIIHIDMILLDETKAVTPSYQWLSYVFMSEEITFDLFKVAYHIFSLIFSLLYTSGVVYTIACIYTGREVTLKKVMSIVPKVRKRLMLTFLCNFVAHFAYNVAALIFAVINFPILIRMDNYFLPLLCVLFIFYLVGLVRIHGHCLAISQRCDPVLEDTSGFHALRRSRALLKGNMWVATFILLLRGLCHFAIQNSFPVLVDQFGSLDAASTFANGIICLVLLFMLLLFGLVLWTVIYFSALSDRLPGYYIGEYVPLKSKDAQLDP
ncbi:hypothetical protein I3760_15G022900 [Carya illinoinensis]|nr:hypothetical protein I3760_15G022900 [Carya illinoinensis]